MSDFSELHSFLPGIFGLKVSVKSFNTVLKLLRLIIDRDLPQGPALDLEEVLSFIVDVAILQQHIDVPVEDDSGLLHSMPTSKEFVAILVFVFSKGNVPIGVHQSTHCLADPIVYFCEI